MRPVRVELMQVASSDRGLVQFDPSDLTGGLADRRSNAIALPV